MRRRRCFYAPAGRRASCRRAGRGRASGLRKDETVAPGTVAMEARLAAIRQAMAGLGMDETPPTKGAGAPDAEGEEQDAPE